VLTGVAVRKRNGPGRAQAATGAVSFLAEARLSKRKARRAYGGIGLSPRKQRSAPTLATSAPVTWFDLQGHLLRASANFIQMQDKASVGYQTDLPRFCGNRESVVGEVGSSGVSSARMRGSVIAGGFLLPPLNRQGSGLASLGLVGSVFRISS
jgi:hypothetical protein